MDIQKELQPVWHQIMDQINIRKGQNINVYLLENLSRVISPVLPDTIVYENGPTTIASEGQEVYHYFIEKADQRNWIKIYS